MRCLNRYGWLAALLSALSFSALAENVLSSITLSGAGAEQALSLESVGSGRLVFAEGKLDASGLVAGINLLSVSAVDSDANTHSLDGFAVKYGSGQFPGAFLTVEDATVAVEATDAVASALTLEELGAGRLVFASGAVAISTLEAGSIPIQTSVTDNFARTSQWHDAVAVYVPGGSLRTVTQSVEVFWGDDPGVGNGTPVSASADMPLLYSGLVALPTTRLPSFYTLSYRATDNRAMQSGVQRQLFATEDTDKDGVVDYNDAFPLNAAEQTDTDGDGIGDNADTDDDNDGALDVVDAFPLDPTEKLDTDGDGIGNNTDTDDDNDGISDVIEGANGLNPLQSNVGVDTDNDGLDDVVEISYKTDPLVADSDGDGLLDGDEVAAGLDPLAFNFSAIASQIITASETTVKTPKDSTFEVTWRYTTSDQWAALGGLGVRLHFDSSKLSLVDSTLLFDTGFLGLGDLQYDYQDYDFDASTDVFYEFRWQDADVLWPGVSLPLDLMKTTFQLSGDLQEFEFSTIKMSIIDNYSRLDGDTQLVYKVIADEVDVGLGAGKAYTTLNLNLSTSSIIYGGATDLSIKLSNPADTAFDLSGVEVSLQVTDPDGFAETLGPYTTNAAGQFSLTDLGAGVDFSFDQKGTWTLQAIFSGNSALKTAVSSPQILQVGASAGYAVIVQGKIGNAEGQDSHNKSTNRIYQTLLDRGFLEQNIFYFNHDTAQDANGDTVPDNTQDGLGIDALPSKLAIQSAIEGLASAVNNQPAPIYVVFIDHGGAKGEFYVSGEETISPAELALWLSTLEANLSVEALLEPRVAVMGFCYSGAFVPALSGDNRLVVASAAADEESYKGALEADGVRVGEYFVEELFQELGKGETFGSAFKVANARTERYTRKDGDASTNSADNAYLDNAAQHPLLDDNGDARGTNDLDNLSLDGQLASSLILGTGPNYDTNSLTNPAAVDSVNATVYLGALATSAELTLIANDNSQVDSAFVEIRAPAKQLLTSGGTTTEQLSTDFTRAILLPPSQSGNPYSDRFYLDKGNFLDAGVYEVFYYVTDSETGKVSSPFRSRVYKDKSANQAPSAVNLLSPANGAETKTVGIFDWSDSVDPEAGRVTYILEIADDTSFTSFNGQSGVYHREEITVSQAVVDIRGDLRDSSSYVWRVIAVDAYGQRTTSLTAGSFTTNNNNAPFGVVQGVLYDANQYTRLDDASMTITVGSVSQTIYPAANGEYLAVVPPGPAIIAISSTNYETQVLSGLEIVAGSIDAPNTTLNLAMVSTDAPLDSDGDGVPDSQDAFPADAAESVDTDGDGLGDNYELTHGLDRTSVDSDGDGISDYDEVVQGTDPLDSSDPALELTVLELSDVNGDGIAEMGQFGLLADGSNTPQIVIVDPVAGTVIKTFSWPADWARPQAIRLADRNNDGIDEIALYGKRKDDGRMQLAVKSGSTGAGMGTWSWPNSWQSPRFVELQDVNGDGLNEYAIFGRYSANNVPQLVVRDGSSKAEIARYKFTPAWKNEIPLQWDDQTNDGIAEVAMFGEHRSNGKSFLFVVDGNTPDLKLSQYNWPNKWANPSFHLLPDLDGDGIREPAVFGVNIDDDRPQLQIKKGHTKLGVYAIYNWLDAFSEVQFYQLGDQNDDGIKDFGVLAYNSANGKRQLMVKDGMDRTVTLANYFWPDNWDDTRVVELDDLTGDGKPDLGLIGKHRNTGAVQMQVKDRDTRGLLSTYTFTAADATTAKVINVGDVNGDGTPDIGLYSAESGQGLLEVYSGSDSSALISTLSF